MRKVMDHDPVSGISHVFYYDDMTDEASIVAEQDVKSVVEHNKDQFNQTYGKWGEFAKIASLPLVVYQDLQRKGILDDTKAFKRWLNDPDNRFFRTRPGNV